MDFSPRIPKIGTRSRNKIGGGGQYYMKITGVHLKEVHEMPSLFTGLGSC